MTSRKLAQLIDIKRQSWQAIGCLLGFPMFGLLLSGCAMVGPGYEQPALPMLTSSYQARDSQLQPAQDLDSWWQSFADPTLSQLVSRALGNNLTVQIAVERIVEAQVNVNMNGRKLLPNVNSNCELDLFGGLGRSQQAAQAELLAHEYSLQDVQRTLVADVATSYLRIRLLQNQIEIVEQSLQLQQETTTFVSGRAKAGLVTQIDAEQTVAFLHRTRADKAGLELRLDTEFNRLGILLGESPTSSLRDFVGFGPIPAAPYLPAAGIPTDLIRRRPDIRRSEAEVGVATARVGIAEADLYPRFKLLGALSPAGPSLSPLTGNIFDLGRGNDNVEIHRSQLRQAVGSYRVVVLDAVKEVEDSMAMYDGYQKQLAELESALQSDTKAVELSLQRYEMGKSDFQNVLNVQMQMLEDSQASAEARAQASIQLIKLYKAAGGGWPMQMAAAGGGCAECASGHQGWSQEGSWSSNPSTQQTDFQNYEQYMSQDQSTNQFQDVQHSGPAVFESDPMLPAGSQMISPPQPNGHSILRTEDLGPIEFNPNMGQLRQQIPSDSAGKEVLAEMFDWDEKAAAVASIPKARLPQQQLPSGSAEGNELAEMFDWDKKDAAVVKSLRQNQSPDSPVANTGYFTESPRVNNKQNTQKASSIRAAPMVWDSERIKVD